MAKRYAAVKHALTSVKKKPFIEMADSLKTTRSSKEMSCGSRFKTLTASPKEHANLSAITSSEDSGIELTPDVSDDSKSMKCNPSLPGFSLNRPKSFPAPKFDFPSAPERNSKSTEFLDGKMPSEKSSTCIHSDLERTGDDFAKDKDFVEFSSNISDLSENSAHKPYLESTSSNLSIKTKTYHVPMPTACVIKSNTNINQNAVLNASKSLDDATEAKQNKPAVKLKKISHEVELSPGQQRELVKSDKTEKPSTFSHLLESSARTKKKEAGMEKEHCRPKPTSLLQASRKRPSDDTKKPVASHSSKKSPKKAKAEDQVKSLGSDPKKGKRTVLPAALLNKVVKTVEGNVRNISTQVIKSAAAKGSSPISTDSVSGSRKTYEKCSLTQGSAPSTHDQRESSNNSLTKTDKESSERLVSDHVVQPITSTRRLEDKMGEKTRDEDDFNSSKLPKQNANKSSKPQRTVVSPTKTKHIKSKESINDIYEPESVSPIECTDIPKDLAAVQKLKKKAKKKRKNKQQRKSTEADGSLFDQLPRYCPENDSRMKKKREDKVYNLSELFSGKLLYGRSAEKRSRPNYFLAIQITNPEIKAKLSTVHQSVEEACPKLKPSFVSVDSAHLTLGVMHLPDQDAVDRAISAMEKFRMVQQQTKPSANQTEEQQGKHNNNEREEEQSAQEAQCLTNKNNQVVDTEQLQGECKDEETPEKEEQSSKKANQAEEQTAQKLQEEFQTTNKTCDQIQMVPDRDEKKEQMADKEDKEILTENTKIEEECLVLVKEPEVTVVAFEVENQEMLNGAKENENGGQNMDLMVEKEMEQKEKEMQGDTVEEEEVLTLNNKEKTENKYQSNSFADEENKTKTTNMTEHENHTENQGDTEKETDNHKLKHSLQPEDTKDPEKGECADPQEKHETEDQNISKQELAVMGEEDTPADKPEIAAAAATATASLTLEVKGLGTFSNDVVFAKVTGGSDLDQVTAMAELLRSCILDQNITMDSKPFAPHITLMKTSKDIRKLRAAGIKKIDSTLYEEFADTCFGSNAVSSIQLCSMLKPKQNKYYHVEHEIPIDLG